VWRVSGHDVRCGSEHCPDLPMTSVSYICVLYGNSRNFDVKARRAACAQLRARCQDPLSPSSMSQRSPLSVVVPEENSLLLLFQIQSSRGQFYCLTETDSATRVAIRSITPLSVSRTREKQMLQILQQRPFDLHRILHDLTRVLKPLSRSTCRPTTCLHR
jgi:hypothetical protein